MIQKFLEIKIETNGQNLINISQEIEKFVENSGIKCGILNLSILHTSASLIIQENVSKDVLIDLENFFNKLVPMNENLYSHILEGKDEICNITERAKKKKRKKSKKKKSSFY